MSKSTPETESFDDFKNSFSYGTRSDLNFKFLKNLSSEDAALFFQELFAALGESLDDGRFERVVRHIIEWQAAGYARPTSWKYSNGPFTPMRKPLSASRLALLTSSGHFVAGDDPQPFGVHNMTQVEATQRIDDFIKHEPQLSTIPFGTSPDQLRVRHGGYDLHAAQHDPEVVLPLRRLVELKAEGLVGELASNAYSFVGACSQKLLLKNVAHRWADLLQSQGVEATLLVPV